MSRIRSKDTKPELLVRKFLFSEGFRYRLHEKKLPGKPDIVLPKYKTVVFIHGCFWHAHEHCRYATMPVTNGEWWQAKLNKNRQRDLVASENLASLGWRVIVVWSCNLKAKNFIQSLVSLANQIRSTK